MQAQAAHATRLLLHGPPPQSFDSQMPLDIRQVMLVAQGRTLFGWLALPAWHGEDGNPDDFQMLYGEVNLRGDAVRLA